MRAGRPLLVGFALLLGAVAPASPAPAPAAAAAAPAGPPIRLALDATGAPRRVLRAHLTLPAAPGPLTLYYPKWIPGEHGPTGPITDLVDLKFTAGRQALPWRRDPTDMYSFQLTVPPGAKEVEADLAFLLSTDTEGFSSGASASARLAVVSWNQVLLYPAGRPAAEILFAPSVRLPAGWKFATALDVRKSEGADVDFAPVSLVTLVDSPLLAGAYFRVVPLASQPVPHRIDAAADSAAALELLPRHVAGYERLIGEAQALFGAHHYRHYDFLLALSDEVASFGLEHHESSDDRLPERTLIDETKAKYAATLLPHEFVHSWNGKYRRPADLVQPDYQQPIRSELLWVYEGLTEYLGSLLAVRSGLWTEADYREYAAWVAAYLDRRGGRGWRPLEDTATAAQLLYEASSAWANERRAADFYDESHLIWLEADARIRQQTKGERSLDDFCRRFHGGASGPPEVVTYTADDVVRTLNEVAPGDWAAFFATRVQAVAPRAPVGGLEASGWRLVFDDTPNEYVKAEEEVDERVQATFSLGFWLDKEGMLGDVVPGSPAEQAGLSPGMTLVAVDGRRYTPEVLHDAIRAAKTDRDPIDLLVENADYYRTYKLDHHGGERYPHLERIPGRPDLLADILKPRAAAAKRKN